MGCRWWGGGGWRWCGVGTWWCGGGRWSRGSALGKGTAGGVCGESGLAAGWGSTFKRARKKATGQTGQTEETLNEQRSGDPRNAGEGGKERGQKDARKIKTE
eukprot:GHVT01024256.1.p3 GENE.GHVT01024256.1~~GHVT01024256.1.p3  ORF type:complete len:102 (+),score=18.65 GHVT01024256.1:1038-1343(+)